MNGKFSKSRLFLNTFPAFSLLLILSSSFLSAFAQDWVKTGTNLGVQRIRLAAADFKAASADAQTAPLKTVFAIRSNSISPCVPEVIFLTISTVRSPRHCFRQRGR